MSKKSSTIGGPGYKNFEDKADVGLVIVGSIWVLGSIYGLVEVDKMSVRAATVNKTQTSTLRRTLSKPLSKAINHISNPQL